MTQEHIDSNVGSTFDFHLHCSRIQGEFTLFICEKDIFALFLDMYTHDIVTHCDSFVGMSVLGNSACASSV